MSRKSAAELSPESRYLCQLCMAVSSASCVELPGLKPNCREERIEFVIRWRKVYYGTPE